MGSAAALRKIWSLLDEDFPAMLVMLRINGDGALLGAALIMVLLAIVNMLFAWIGTIAFFC